MSDIRVGELPHDALLNKYERQSAYTDCYFVDVNGRVTQAEYVESFYTSGLFKVERCILSLLASKPSSDLQARQLAYGQAASFAAWRVEDRTTNQLLLCDFLGRTRSWLMSMSNDGSDFPTTRLYFGSAVVPKKASASGRASMGFVFHALSGFHRVYSRALLRAALRKLSCSVRKRV